MKKHIHSFFTQHRDLSSLMNPKNQYSNAPGGKSNAPRTVTTRDANSKKIKGDATSQTKGKPRKT